MSLQHSSSDHPPPYLNSPLSDSSLKLPPLPSGAPPDRPLQLPSIESLTPKPSPSLDIDNAARRSKLPPIPDSTDSVLHPLRLTSISSRGSETPALSVESSNRTMAPDDRSRKRDQSVSMDDPDDRMAAEALCGLGKASSTRLERSPTGYETPLQYYPIGLEHTRPASSHDEPEPLLSLLTSSHPWLAGTINHSISAYSSTKSHSPRFIQYGANFVERNIGSPMASTVGSVGRKTGVEGGLRRYLSSHRPSNELDRIDPEILSQGAAPKRRKISNEEDMDVENRELQRTSSGHTSIDTLPVYDDNRSPAYEPSDISTPPDPTNSSRSLQKRGLQVPRSWSTQLMISTSGLGAALNVASLRSLKYCLTILRSANSHLTYLMEALKRLLSDYNNDTSSSHRLEEGHTEQNMQLDLSDGNKESTISLTERIQKLNTEIWNTLKKVVDTVSRHTGGALPENASVVVRWQLMSVPRRWQRAASTSRSSQGSENGASAEQEAVTNAHRMLAFAIEGIDMMEQVSGVVDSTIVSAERWLESMGKKKKTEDQLADENMQTELEPRSSNDDVPMDNTSEGQNANEDKEMAIDGST